MCAGYARARSRAGYRYSLANNYYCCAINFQTRSLDAKTPPPHSHTQTHKHRKHISQILHAKNYVPPHNRHHHTHVHICKHWAVCVCGALPHILWPRPIHGSRDETASLCALVGWPRLGWSGMWVGRRLSIDMQLYATVMKSIWILYYLLTLVAIEIVGTCQLIGFSLCAVGKLQWFVDYQSAIAIRDCLSFPSAFGHMISTNIGYRICVQHLINSVYVYSSFQVSHLGEIRVSIIIYTLTLFHFWIDNYLISITRSL